MITKINNLSDARIALIENYSLLRANKRTVEKALEVNRTVGKIIKINLLKLKHKNQIS